MGANHIHWNHVTASCVELTCDLMISLRTTPIITSYITIHEESFRASEHSNLQLLYTSAIRLLEFCLSLDRPRKVPGSSDKPPRMDDTPDKAKALLLPADGSMVRLVTYQIKYRSNDDDFVDSRLAEFFDPVPDLKPWLGDAYRERALATFFVDTQRRSYHDPVTRAFIKSDEVAVHGQYCLYYTLSQTLPLNKNCTRIIDTEPSSERLFWRGNVLVVRYEGHLGIGHVYKDVDKSLITAVEELLKKSYESQGLERIH